MRINEIAVTIKESRCARDEGGVDFFGVAPRTWLTALTARVATTLQGKLSFLLSQFAKVGRTALPTLHSHAVSGASSPSDITFDALSFMQLSVVRRPRSSRSFDRSSLTFDAPPTPPVLLWNDAIFERNGIRVPEPVPGCTAALGIVVISPRQQRLYVGTCRRSPSPERSIEHELLELAFSDKVNYVGQAERRACRARGSRDFRRFACR